MNQEQIDLYNQLINLAKITLPPLLTLLSGYLGFWYGRGQFKNQKKLEFVERQIREFYSPMLGYVKQKRAKSDLRYEIDQVSNSAWEKIVKRQPETFPDHDEHFEPFEKAMRYDIEQFRDELIPLYDKMVTIFTENYWLAEPETTEWYSELLRFVDLWHRWLDQTIPAEVIKEMKNTETRLMPFYENLEATLENLKKKLVGK